MFRPVCSLVSVAGPFHTANPRARVLDNVRIPPRIRGFAVRFERMREA